MGCKLNALVIRDATLLVICWYSLIVSLCMLYVLHTHSSTSSSTVNPVAGGAPSSPLHVALARSAGADPQENPGWLRQLNPKEVTTIGPDHTVISGTTKKSNQHAGYTLLDKDVPLDLHCDRCSLVSSSGQLLNSGAGADIDNADCVLRMNSAPVRGYEEDVGIRTDVRVIGHVNLARGLMTSAELRDEILGDPATRTGIVVVPWLYQERINKTNNTVYTAARNMSEMYPNLKFFFLTSEKINQTEERFRIETGVSLNDAKTWLSTGFVAMLFAIDICNRIDVYGLSNVDYCMRHPNSTSPYHYYEPGIRRECDYYKWSETQMTKGHKFMTEKAVFARWSLGYNIHFHYPSWRATIKNVTAELDTPFLQLYKEALKNGTLEQIRKAAPHVRVVHRVKVIRRRVRKPRPKIVKTQPKNKTIVMPAPEKAIKPIVNEDTLFDLANAPKETSDLKGSEDRLIENKHRNVELANDADLLIVRHESNGKNVIERHVDSEKEGTVSGKVYPIKRKLYLPHIKPRT